MFWGLIMEPQRRYTQKVKKAFHISMAAMDISTSSEEPAQVMCGFEGRNYLLCTLKKPDTMQVPLDLNFNVGDELSFAANGKCHIHLTGYLIEDYPELQELEELEEEEEIEQEKVKKKDKKRSTKEGAENGPPLKKAKATTTNEDDEDEEDSDDDDDSDVDIQDLLGKSLDEDDNDGSFMEEEADEDEEGEDEEDSDEEEDEVADEEVSSMSEPESEEEEVPKKKGAVTKINGIPAKKQKPETPVQNKQNKEMKTLKTPKSAKENQTPKEVKKEKKTPEKANQTPSKKKVLQGGVIVEDLTEGQGANAKNGRFVTVYYEGRLKQNNKLFDSTNKGNGFSFRLGAGEVIKGWDIGVAGMKVGGKRKITCPPEMAYGAKGSPPTIPANSTLVFEVEMRKIR